MAEATVGRWPMPAVVAPGDLGSLSEAEGAGSRTHLIEDRSGWRAKLYENPGDRSAVDRLDELVALPGVLPAEDSATLRNRTAWPVARITTPDDEVRGCVIPAIPEKFAPLDEQHATKPSRADRLRACRNLVAVAEVLERHDLVHSDWSCSTVLWQPDDASVFVIDIDRCGRGAVPNTCRAGWEDPLTPPPNEADAATARFRVASLVARFLTGKREGAAAITALAGSDGFGNRGLREILLDILLSSDREQRPSMVELGTVLAGELYGRYGSFPARGPVPAGVADRASGAAREPISVEYLD